MLSYLRDLMSRREANPFTLYLLLLDGSDFTDFQVQSVDDLGLAGVLEENTEESLMIPWTAVAFMSVSHTQDTTT